MSSYAIDENFSPEGSELSNQASVSEESNEVANADPDARPTKIRQARACAECNRKKIKCDKRTPRCSLCIRTGHECFYPKKRRRPTRVWQLNYSPQRLLEVAGEDGLNQLLDNLGPTMLRKALLRHDERGDSVSDPTVVATDEIPPQPLDQMILPESAPQVEVDRAREISSSLVYQPEARFGPDGFDQSLETWLVDSFMNAPSCSEFYQGQDGQITDFSQFRAQHAAIDGEMDLDPNFQFGGFAQVNPDATDDNNGVATRYSMLIPAPVMDEIFETFFKHVSCWLPLFHRPRLYAKFKVHDPNPEKYQGLCLEDCLILNSICALTARLSTASYFAHVPPKSRAEPFLNEATRLFQLSMKLESVVQPNLALLQGLILLGWYHQVCGSSGRCGSLIGISCRLAYDLGLNDIDQEALESKAEVQWSSPEEWSKTEELRRAWWLVWELDMFSGTILHRPHTIDKTQINVLLPVCDEAWFADTPVPSVPVITDPVQVWKSLKDSVNQHERAWFLVASFIRAFATDLVHRRQTSAQLMADFQACITCFCLSLPRQFHLSRSCLSFDETNYAAKNWIVCTHLIIQSSRASFRLCCHQKFPDLLDVPLETSAQEDEKLISRLMRGWDPNYIAEACPLVATTVLGPSAVNAKFAFELATDPDNPRPLYLEMVKLVLGKIGTYWEIGALILDKFLLPFSPSDFVRLTFVAQLVHMLEARRPVAELVDPRKNDLDRLPFLIPKADEVGS